MAETIRGINVVIGAETTALNAALKDVNKVSSDIAKELRQVNNQLKFEPRNTELLAQKQKLLGDQVENTRKKLDALKQAQEQVNEQFAKGEIGEEQHRKFQRELIKTESQLKLYEKQLKQAQIASNEFNIKTQALAERLEGLGNKLEEAGRKMAPLSAIGAGVAGALTSLALKAGQVSDDLHTMSATTGLAMETLQKFQYASELIDVSMETLAGSLSRLTRTMGNARDGNKQAREAFDVLGVSITDVNGNLRDNEDVFGDVINALGEIEEGTERDVVAMKLFGRSAQDLNPLILGGADALKQLGDEAKEAGLILSDEALADALELKDGIDKLKATLSATATSLGATVSKVLIPAFESISEKVQGVLTWLRSLDERMLKLVLVIAAVVAAIGPLLVIFGQMSIGVASLTSALGTLVAFINTKLIPAILGISLKTVAITAAVAAIVAAAYVVIRAWEDAKNGLIATWDGIKASIERLALNITLAVEKMKLAAYELLDSFMQVFSRLENMPIIGHMFTSATNAIDRSVANTKTRIDELTTALDNNTEKAQDALQRRQEAIAGIGEQIAEDIETVKRFFGLGAVEAAEIDEGDFQESLDNLLFQLGEFQDDYTETVVGGSEEVNKERERFEEQWTKRLFELSADRLAKLEKEYDEAIALAEELGADKTAVEEYFASVRIQIAQDEEERKSELARKEAEKRAEEARKARERIEQIEATYQKRLFEQSASRIDILQREKQEQIAIALEAGANWLLIDKYYNNLIAEERQRQADELAKIAQDEADEVARLAKEKTDAELAELKRLSDERERFNLDYHRRLFEQSADRIDILQREKQEQIAIAMELGADWIVVDTYYNQLIADERQKRAEEIFRIAKQEAEEERLIQERKAEEIARVEANWQKRLFEQSADRIDILQREKQEQIQLAMEAGADWLAIDEYYNNEIIKERERRADELARIAEAEAQAQLAKQEKLQKDRLSFEQSWADKLAGLARSPEERLANLERERERILADAEKLNADIGSVNAYYAEQRARIELEIAESQKGFWEKTFDSLQPPFERLQKSLANAAGSLLDVVKAISSGNWIDALLTILMETESFAKAMELLGAVLDPVIALFDAVLAPIINAILWVWNGVITALSKISIFGWKPFGGLADKTIDPVGGGGGDDGGGGGTAKGGRQYSEISGPFRDTLTDLLAPLAQFGQIVSPIRSMAQDVASINAKIPHYGDFAIAGQGAINSSSFSVTIQNLNVKGTAGSVADLGKMSARDLERELAKIFVKQRRGGFGN